MRCSIAVFLACMLGLVLAETHDIKNGKHTKKHHGKSHHHHHHHHGKHHHHKHHKPHGKESAHVVNSIDKAVIRSGAIGTFAAGSHLRGTKSTMTVPHTAKATVKVKEDTIVKKMKALEEKLAKKKAMIPMKQGEILVNGPLPADFKERFIQAMAAATNADKSQVKINGASPSGSDGVMKISFAASPNVVDAIEEEAADPDSKLANGNLHSFLVSKDEGEEEKPKQQETSSAAPVEENGIDIDTAMPYGDLEPFGREDTAQELTEDSIQESNGMVDQLERAEVAEEKRAVFRALTRLRGAAITSFDGVARSQTGNIDEYNKIHKWRSTHPLHHLADEESDVSKWAFPDNADF